MAKLATLVGVAEDSEEDASHVLFVNFDGLTYPVQVGPEQLPKLIARLQNAAIDRAERETQTVLLPQYDVERFDLAHQGREVGLMVATAQAGRMVFRMSDTHLEQLDAQLQRMRTYRSAPNASQ